MKQKLLSYLFTSLVFTVAYLIAAEIGYAFAIEGTTVSPIWPAAGVALGALLTRGYRLIPSVILGSFLAQLMVLVTSNGLAVSSSILIALMVSAGCTLSALAGAFLVKTLIGKRNVIESVWDVIKFVFLAAISSTTIGATVATLALGLGGLFEWGSYGYLWWTWWTGAGVSILLIVPVMVTCCLRPAFIRSPMRVLEMASFLVFFIIIHQLAIGDWLPQLVATHPFDNILAPFFLFLILLAIFRFEQFGSTAFVFLAWALLIWDTERGLGPFLRETPVESFLTLQASMGLLAVILMFLTANMNEHYDVVQKLKKARDDLELRVRERTRELSEANLDLEREVAERKRAEGKILESKEKLKAQYKGIPIPTYTWQRAGDDFTLIDYNDAAEEITHGGISRLVGRRASDLYLDDPGILDDLLKCYRERVVVKREILYRFRSTGEEKYLAMSCAFVPPDLVLVHTDDITDRKKAEEQIINHRKALERRTSDLAALYEVSTAISNTIDLEKLLNHVLETITDLELFKVEKKGGVFVIEGDRLKLVAHMGHPKDFLELHEDMRVGDCLCGLAAKTGEIIVSGNSDHDEDHSFRYGGMKPHGHVIVPLKVADRVVGVSYFYFPADFKISKRELELLATIGNQLGIAIENSRLYEETKKLSLHDPLTGLANRNLMNIELTRIFAQSKRSGLPLSLIMMDIDFFKKYNDTFGHAAGDKLLVDIAGITGREIRDVDIAVRYGGEEFLLILPNTEAAAAYEVAERLRSSIEGADLYHEGHIPIQITVSLGIATISEDVSIVDQLINMADDALYQAKRNGRDRVETWSSGSRTP